MLVHDPEALLRFDDNDIVLPITVIEELDNLKKGHGEISCSARQTLRLIDSFRHDGDRLSTGVRLSSGGSLKVVFTEKLHLDKVSADNRIISVAVELSKSNGNGTNQTVVLISKDTSVRIKAESLGVKTRDYEIDKTTVFQKYGRILNRTGYQNGINSVRYHTHGDRILRITGRDPNLKIKKVQRQRTVIGITPKNIEQECAVDALLADKINIVALTGKAGTGKTLLSLACGLYLCQINSQRSSSEHVNINTYDQVVVGRPIVPLGNDLGYLPGDVQEKLRPYMQPLFDNLDVIVNSPSGKKDNRHILYKSSDYLVESGIVHIEPLTYIRGRGLPRRYIIIDEAQNLRPLEVKTIITRCGEGTKVVFTGELEQIDNPFLDATSNGIAYLISRFIQEKDFCYLNLTKGARSALAEKAARLL